IVILPSDKGKNTVVMNKSDYTAKCVDLLKDDTTYEQQKTDTTPAIERKMNSILLQLMKQEKLSKQQYNNLRSSETQTPKFYGLPKVHKPNVPLRPIIAMCGTPTHKLAKFLAMQLGHYVKGQHT